MNIPFIDSYIQTHEFAVVIIILKKNNYKIIILSYPICLANVLIIVLMFQVPQAGTDVLTTSYVRKDNIKQ